MSTYDRDKPSTFTKQRKCGGCGWWFDLAREGTDYTDETTRERVTLCGECCAECEAEAAVLVKVLERMATARAPKPPRPAIEEARDEAAIRNARNFGTDPSWYGR